MNAKGISNVKDLFHDQLKILDNNLLKHIYANVSVFYKIPPSDLRRKYKFSEVKEMFVDIIYYQSKTEVEE